MNNILSPEGTWWASVDTGESFTHACAFVPGTGKFITASVPSVTGGATSPTDPLMLLAEKCGLLVEDLTLIIHGTTLPINSILRGNISKTAILTTRGFRDLLLIGQHCDNNLLFGEGSKNLFFRRNIYEVSERILPGGSVLKPLDESQLAGLAPLLLKSGIDSVAICFLHSCDNPAHEQKAGEYIKRLLPGIPVFMSHETMPCPGEFDRFSATAVSAAISTSICFSQFEEKIKSLPGRSKGVLFMQSDGSVAPARRCLSRPAGSLLSSHAGGVNACWELSRKTRRPNLIALDIGSGCIGVSVIHRGKPLYEERATAGGYPLGSPLLSTYVVEMDQHHAAGGADAAAGSQIAAAVKGLLLSKGFDPGEYTLVAYGGAGPVYAAEIARSAGMPFVLVPPDPGAFSARGMLSPIRMDYSHSLCTAIVEADPDCLHQAFSRLEEKALADFEEAGIPAVHINKSRSVDMRYRGQALEINMQFPSGKLKNADLALLGRAFNITFEAEYGFIPEEIPAEIVRLCLSATCNELNTPEGARISSFQQPALQHAPDCIRNVFFGSNQAETPVYFRNSLSQQTFLRGPAVIEEAGTATLVWPEMSMSVDSYGNLVIDVGVK